MILCGQRSTLESLDASGPFFVAGYYFVDLDKHVVKTEVKSRHWHFCCSCFGVRTVFWASDMCSRALLVTLRRACLIALIVARCEFAIARATLLTLCHCCFGAVWILGSFAQHCVTVSAFASQIAPLLWRGADFQQILRSMSSVEGPSKTIFQELHGPVLKARMIWSSWPRSCRGPCEKILWWSRHWRPWGVLAWSCTDPCQKILCRSW